MPGGKVRAARRRLLPDPLNVTRLDHGKEAFTHSLIVGPSGKTGNSALLDRFLLAK